MSSSQTGDAACMRHEQPRVRDMPTKRNLNSEFSRTTDTRTGEMFRQDKGEVNNPSKDKYRHGFRKEKDLRDSLESHREQDLRNKLMAQNQQRQRDRAWDEAWEHKGKDKATSSTVKRHASTVDWVDPLGEPGMHGG